ncbi:MAG: endonuclease III [Clostridiales bacterium]|nr:endonuclease III [Clostridiales bacterium]
MDKEKAGKTVALLRAHYGEAVCELNYSTPFQLLVAVILSAQCTDKRVNLVTKELFKVYNTPEQFAALTKEELSGYISTCGLFNGKAVSIISAAKDICVKFGGRVPDNITDLLTLRGVGRKTANVILCEAYKIPAIPVDTHVLRLANRIGLSNGSTPEAVEKDVAALLDPSLYIESHHLLIKHGRNICKAVRPDCDNCPLCKVCEYFDM